MKNSLILLTVLLITSCSRYASLPTDPCCIRKPDSQFVIRYGDDRFHDDGDLIDEFYSVYGTDTVHTFTRQRVRNSKPTKYVK